MVGWNVLWASYVEQASQVTQVMTARGALMQQMATDPAAASDVSNWLELHRMVQEKWSALGQAGWIAAIEIAKLGPHPTQASLARLNERVSEPVARTLGANASRLKRRR